MKGRLIYVELKTGHGDNGPAWIGVAGTSKSGATIYLNGEAYKSLKGSGIGANYFNVVTGDQYWISGVKKNNQDRHWAGGGDIIIDEAAVKLYLEETGFSKLPSNILVQKLRPAKQSELQAELEHEELTFDGQSRVRRAINSIKRTF